MKTKILLGAGIGVALLASAVAWQPVLNGPSEKERIAQVVKENNEAIVKLQEAFKELEPHRQELLERETKIKEQREQVEARMTNITESANRLRKANEALLNGTDIATEEPTAPTVSILPVAEAKEEVANCKDYVLTAYYSPLPGQSWYAEGSYEAEKRMNGNGTHGASGTPVFDGMIAAPSSYAFGTKISFDGMGEYEVQDRGGAIKGNRIDVWMGKGEDALNKAMRFGKKTVRGCIL